MNGFENLEVWKKAHQLVLEVYKITKNFPTSEQYGITSQLRRAASSIPANIVEGRGRNTDKEFIQFVFVARGSVEEVKYFLILSKDLKYIDEENYERLMKQSIEVGRMLNGFIRALKNKRNY